jgi:hypothetical protein
MATVLQDTTVVGIVTQTQLASADNHLLRLGEAKKLLNSQFQGGWNTGTIYAVQQGVNWQGSFYISNVDNNQGNPPDTSPTQWRLAAQGGQSAYVYVAYADDANGSGFTTTFNAAKNFIAILVTVTPVVSPQASNFAGLWKNYQGQSYLYVAYASDANGGGFSLTPASNLDYIAWLTTNAPLATPQASNFAGLWVDYQGPQGTPGQSAYVYVAYADDANGTGFTATFNAAKNYIAIKTTVTPIASPQASDFAGLWKQYGSPISVSGALTLTGGVLGLNASSTATANFLVQRDANGGFSANVISASSVVIGGSATLSFSSGALSINQPISVGGLTVSGLSGVLKAANGLISGSATTNDLTEGSNLYFTNARVLATPLTGLSSTNVLLASDTVLSAFGKLDNVLGGNFPAGTISGNLSVSGNLTVTGNTTLKTSLNGILLATSGVVSGSATTDNVPEGTVNLFFTNARADGRISAQRGVANGIAPLDASGKVPLANLYAYGATPYGAASQSAMLNLASAKQGDFCLRSDQNIVYVLSNNTPAVLSSWAAWLYPVASVNGATGAVVLATDSIAEGITNLYFTNARADARISAQRGAANGICPLDANSLVPSANLPPVGNSIWIVNSQSTQTNLSSALKGDLANRTDQNQTYILSNNTPSSFASWVPLLYPVASVNGLTGAVTLTTTNIAEGSNLYFNTARVIATALTGFVAGAGTVSASDTILTALQKHDAAITGKANLAGATFTGLVQFSGTNNPGLLVNQLSTSQIGSLTTTSANYGNIVYDTTAQQLKALVNGSWTVLSAGANLPLSAGSNYKLSGTLYFNDGLSTAIQVGNSWNLRTSNSNQNFDFLNGGTVVLTLDNGNNVRVPNGWYDTGSNTGYKINGQQTLYWSGSSVVLDLGGNWRIGTTSSYAALNIGYGGGSGLQVDQSNDVLVLGTLKMGNNRVIDSNNYFYDSSGRRILAGQQSYFTRPNLSGNYGNDYNNLNTWMYYIQNVLQNHGLMASS